VKNVDDTKFRLADDILNDLSKPNAAPTGWEAWREGQHGRVAWAQTSGRRVEEEFKKWNVEANTKYDEHCELSERMPDTVRAMGKYGKGDPICDTSYCRLAQPAACPSPLKKLVCNGKAVRSVRQAIIPFPIPP
jgi:hypothetical protein